jgi:hypothetical protein
MGPPLVLGSSASAAAASTAAYVASQCSSAADCLAFVRRLRDALVSTQPSFAEEEVEHPAMPTSPTSPLGRTHSTEAQSAFEAVASEQEAADIADGIGGASSPPPPPPGSPSDIEVFLRDGSRSSGAGSLSTQMGSPTSRFGGSKGVSLNRKVGKAVMEAFSCAFSRIDDLVAARLLSSAPLIECRRLMYEAVQALLVHCNTSPQLTTVVSQQNYAALLLDVTDAYVNVSREPVTALVAQQAARLVEQSNLAADPQKARRWRSELDSVKTMLSVKPFTSAQVSTLLSAYCLEFLVDAAMPPAVCSSKFEALQAAAWARKADFIANVADTRQFTAIFLKMLPVQCVLNLVVFALHGEPKIRIRFYDRLVSDGMLSVLQRSLDDAVAALQTTRSSTNLVDPAAATDSDALLHAASCALDVLLLLSAPADTAPSPEEEETLEKPRLRRRTESQAGEASQAADSDTTSANRSKKVGAAANVPKHDDGAPIYGAMMLKTTSTLAYCTSWATRRDTITLVVSVFNLLREAIAMDEGGTTVAYLAGILKEKAAQALSQCSVYSTALLQQIVRGINELVAVHTGPDAVKRQARRAPGGSGDDAGAISTFTTETLAALLPTVEAIVTCVSDIRTNPTLQTAAAGVDTLVDEVITDVASNMARWCRALTDAFRGIAADIGLSIESRRRRGTGGASRKAMRVGGGRQLHRRLLPFFSFWLNVAPKLRKTAQVAAATPMTTAADRRVQFSTRTEAARSATGAEAAATMMDLTPAVESMGQAVLACARRLLDAYPHSQLGRDSMALTAARCVAQLQYEFSEPANLSLSSSFASTLAQPAEKRTRRETSTPAALENTLQLETLRSLSERSIRSPTPPPAMVDAAPEPVSPSPAPRTTSQKKSVSLPPTRSMEKADVGMATLSPANKSGARRTRHVSAVKSEARSEDLTAAAKSTPPSKGASPARKRPLAGQDQSPRSKHGDQPTTAQVLPSTTLASARKGAGSLAAAFGKSEANALASSPTGKGERRRPPMNPEFDDLSPPNMTTASKSVVAVNSGRGSTLRSGRRLGNPSTLAAAFDSVANDRTVKGPRQRSKKPDSPPPSAVGVGLVDNTNSPEMTLGQMLSLRGATRPPDPAPPQRQPVVAESDDQGGSQGETDAPSLRRRVSDFVASIVSSLSRPSSPERPPASQSLPSSPAAEQPSQQNEDASPEAITRSWSNRWSKGARA